MDDKATTAIHTYLAGSLRFACQNNKSSTAAKPCYLDLMFASATSIIMIMKIVQGPVIILTLVGLMLPLWHGIFGCW